MSTLSVRDLDVTLGGLPVLRGVGLEVPSGSVAAAHPLRHSTSWASARAASSLTSANSRVASARVDSSVSRRARSDSIW